MTTQFSRAMAALFFGVAFFFAGCGGTQLQVKSIPADANPTSLLADFEKNLDEAQQAKVDALSPVWYSRAEESFWEAKALHGEGGSLKEIFEKISVGKAQLERANKTAPVAKMVISEAIEARAKAIDAGANELTEGFTDAEREFLSLTRDIEEGDKKSAEKNKKDVEAMYRTVEIRAIKDEALREARVRLAQLKIIKARKSVPEAVEEAEAAFRKAHAYIDQYPRNAAGVKKHAGKAAFLANRAYNLAVESRLIEQEEPSDTALLMEDTFFQLAQSAGLPDIRNLSFDKQFQEIQSRVVSLRQASKELQDRSTSLKTALSRLKEDQADQMARLNEERQAEERVLQRLKEDKAFNEKFERVRGFFTEEEADVYKEGGKLVLRMKGIEFPVGKAVLLSKNFPLLEKVIEAIQEFDSADVTVEGHTDSRGSSRVNQIISETRAKEVVDYLISHGHVAEDRVLAEGFGFNKPIATNRTVKGRAANRRIDVIIRPDQPEI